MEAHGPSQKPDKNHGSEIDGDKEAENLQYHQHGTNREMLRDDLRSNKKPFYRQNPLAQMVISNPMLKGNLREGKERGEKI